MEKTITMKLSDYESFIKEKKELEEKKIKHLTLDYNGYVGFYKEYIEYLSENETIEDLTLKIKALENDIEKLKNRSFFDRLFNII